MTTRRKVFTGLVLAAIAAVAGCLDALAPGAPHRVGSLGIVPVFEGAAARDGIPSDVDSIVVTIHNPPAPDITVGQHVDPGQDSIVIRIDVPMGDAAVDTVTMGFVALRTNGNGSVDTLYTGTQDIPVRVGQPSQADSVAVRYVGPGQNIRSLTLTPRAVVLQPGGTFSAWAVAALDSTDATIVGMPVLWHSDDPATVSIDATGLARGLATGQTYVFAVSGARSSVYDSALVVVSTAPVAVIGLAPGSATFSATASGANPAAQTVAVTNTGVGPLAGLAVGTVTYGASEPTGWLTATLSGASAPATLTLQPATGTLTAGTYHATVPVTSAQASNSPQTVAVTFTVSGAPAIGLSPAAVTFTDTLTTSDPAAKTVAVTNAGTGTLNGLAVGAINYVSGSGWLTASLDQATAPATLTLSVAKGGLAAGTYTATVPITSAAAGNSPQSVSVTFTIAPLPLIGLGATSVTFTDTLTTSDPAAKTVAVTNAGTGTLNGLAVGTINYVSGSGWLTASLDQATAPATLTLSVAKGGLAAGTYTATVPITSGVASNSPQSVSVTFTIAPLPLIGLGAAVVTFTDTMTTSDPAAQTVAVTNVGTGTLNGLAVGTINYVSGSGWLTASLDQATAPATLTLTVAKGSLTPGIYAATVPVTSAAAGNSPQSVSVTFTIAPLPLIGLAPSAVTFTDTLLTADPASRTVAVTNAGTGTLNGLAVGTINYVTGSGWLTASLDQATAPATLTLSVAKGGLAAGTYTATVPVTSAAAGNSPQSVSVTFNVLPVPLARMVVTPGFGVVPPAGTLPLAVQGFNAASGPAPTFGLRYLSRAPGVASVDSLTGLVTGVAGGSAVIVASAPGTSGTVSDSTLVAVPTAGVAVALPMSNAHAFSVANVGDTVHVVVTVNLGAVPGELVGSYNAELNWNAGVLQYVSTTPISLVGGTTLNESNTSTGDLRFGSADPSGTAGPGLVDVKFVARASGASPVTFALTDLSGLSPTFTQMLTQALVLSGSVQVR